MPFTLLRPNDIAEALDKKCMAELNLLDLSPTFDVIDHKRNLPYPGSPLLDQFFSE